MNISELHPLLLVTTPRNEVLKISNVYPNSATAQKVYPIPRRDQVRTLLAHDITALRPASDVMVAKYEEAWDLA